MPIMPQNKMSDFDPIKIILLDLDVPVQDIINQIDHDMAEYSRAMILVRLHNQPLGIFELDISETGKDIKRITDQIWEKIQIPIRLHLLDDGIVLPDSWDVMNMQLEANTIPLCVSKRNRILKDAPFVSVVIATRDRVAALRDCIESILDLDYSKFEVIIVDNAPMSDATEKFIKSTFSDTSKVRYIREDVPGLAIAHNRAINELNSSIVVFTDDDVLVDRNWLKSIVENFLVDSQVACVTGMILPYEIETFPQLWIEQFGGFGKGCERIFFDMAENHRNDILYPYSAGRFGSGANMAFRTDVLKALGGFDSSLGAGTFAKGGDDLAAFFDVVTSGYKLVYEPAAILYHKHRRDYPGLANQAYGYGIGLSAYLMRVITNDPKRLLDIMLRIPAGLRHILDPRSAKNQKKKEDYPQELTRLELRGFLWGPFAYLRSRLNTKKLLNISMDSEQAQLKKL